jgi:hypothetical protein
VKPASGRRLPRGRSAWLSVALELNRGPRIVSQIAGWAPQSPPESPIQHILSPGALNLRAGDFFARLLATSREPRGRAAAMRWNLNAGRALSPIVIRGGGATGDD